MMKRLIFAMLLIAASMTAQAENRLRINNISDRCRFGRMNQEKVAQQGILRDIDVIVVHSAYNPSAKADSFNVKSVIDIFHHYNVEPHYIIDREGEVYQMADEREICFHAGPSMLPDSTRTHINNTSIGIELVNSPRTVITEAQYSSLVSLVYYICSRYHIKYLLGHKHIAPLRKTDPWNFPWTRFYDDLLWTGTRYE